MSGIYHAIENVCFQIAGSCRVRVEEIDCDPTVVTALYNIFRQGLAGAVVPSKRRTANGGPSICGLTGRFFHLDWFCKFGASSSVVWIQIMSYEKDYASGKGADEETLHGVCICVLC